MGWDVVKLQGTSCVAPPTPAITGCTAYVDATHCGATDPTKATLPGAGTTPAGYLGTALITIPNCATHYANQNLGC